LPGGALKTEKLSDIHLYVLLAVSLAKENDFPCLINVLREFLKFFKKTNKIVRPIR